MKRSQFNTALVMLLVAVGAAALAGSEVNDPEGGYDLSWFTIDGGGGESSGGSFSLAGTIGQPDAGGALTGGGYSLEGGFWPAAGDPVDLCPADISGDGVINVTDLLAVINNWGAGAGNPADVNGDNIVNVHDLLAVIAAWGLCP